MRRLARWSLCAGAVGSAIGFAAPVPVPPTAANPQQAIDPHADEVLKNMTRFMSSRNTFSVDTDIATDVVTKQGQKIQFPAASHITVQRPNKARSDRKGDIADLTFLYDGNKITLYGHKLNMYATSPAPPTLDQAVDFARDRLGLDLPGADLLVNKPYPALTEDVVSSKYLGTSSINGQSCHHLAFRGKDVDWQLWVAEGNQPTPCKYVITSKTEPQSPDFSVEFHNWQFGNRPPAGEFAFVPPPGATRTDFLDPNTPVRKE